MARSVNERVSEKTEEVSPTSGTDSSDTDSQKSPSKTTVTTVDPALSLAPPEEERSWWQRRPKEAPDAIATRRSVFDDPKVAEHYLPLPTWENIHRFDPSERWTVAEERSVIRKIDWRIMFFTCIMFMALELDRSNISQAVSDNMIGDLGMDTNGSWQSLESSCQILTHVAPDFNLGNTVFRLTFLLAELPSQLISKYFGPDRWIPMQLCLWSLVSAVRLSTIHSMVSSSILTCGAGPILAQWTGILPRLPCTFGCVCESLETLRDVTCKS